MRAGAELREMEEAFWGQQGWFPSEVISAFPSTEQWQSHIYSELFILQFLGSQTPLSLDLQKSVLGFLNGAVN